MKNAQETIGEEIIASDGIVYFQENPKATFGVYIGTINSVQTIGTKASIQQEKPTATRLFGAAPGAFFSGSLFDYFPDCFAYARNDGIVSS